MKYNLTIAKDICRMINSSLLYSLLFVTILSIYEKSTTLSLLLLLIPLLLIVLQLIWRYCYQPVLYILFHALLYVPILLIPFPNNCYRYLFLFLLIRESIHGLYLWSHNNETSYDEVPWYIFFFVLLIYIVATYYKYTLLQNTAYTIGILLLLMHFIRYFVYGLGSMLKKTEHSTSMPTKKIMLTNSALIGLFIFTFLILVLFARMFEFDTLLYVIGDLLLRIFKLILQLLLYIVALFRLIFSSNTKEEGTLVEEGENVNNAFSVVTEPSLLAKIISGAIEIAVVILLVYIVIRIISAIARSFLHRYAKDTDIILEINEKKETPHKTNTVSPILDRIKEFFDKSPHAKIRRFYRYKITHYKDKIYQKQDTPTDIANNILQVYDEDISDLTDVYEKARYSNETITETDLNKGGIL